MASVQTVFRKDKLNAKGEAPIHFRIIKNRKVSYVTSGIMMPESHWDFAKNKVKTTHKNSARLNSFLSGKHTELQDQVLEFETVNKGLSTKELKEKIYGKEPANFYDVADELLQKYLADKKIGTYDKDRAIINKIKSFHKNKNLYFQEITPQFLTKLERYLQTEYNNSIDTIGNTMKLLRKVINFAISQDIIEISSNPFLKFKIKTEKTFRTFLTEDELKLIVDLKLDKGSRMDLHRDMFVFASYVGGLRVSDVLMLQWTFFDGTFIYTKIKKSKSQKSLKLPLAALAIIEKYIDKKETTKFIFDMLPNDLNIEDERALDSAISSSTAYINKNLKVIAQKAGIEKNISFHISRHTWATRALRKGISIDKVSKLMGHAQIKETLIYAKIVSEELDKAMDLFND
jgi:site-specific recombinase XerD